MQSVAIHQCYIMRYFVHSTCAIILMGERELIALLSLSSCCHVIVVWVFLAVPRVCLQFVIVIFPDHTHSLSLFQSNIFTFSVNQMTTIS